MGMMRTRHRLHLLATVLAALATILLNAASPAAATQSTPNDASGASNAITATALTINPQLSIAGPLGGLLSPFLSGTLGTLTSVLQTLPDLLLSPVLSTLNGFSATTPASANGPFVAATSTTPPAGCASPWCYSASSGAVNAGVIQLSAGTMQGWVQYDKSSGVDTIHSAASVSNIGLGFLGQANLLNVGQITAQTDCARSGSPLTQTSASVVGTNLLNGAVGVQVTGGSNMLTVKLPGDSTYSTLTAETPSLPMLPAQRTISALGVNVGVSRTSGGALVLAVPTSLSTLLGALGLPALPIALTTSTVTLSLVVGSVAPVTTGSSAQAWGLEIGADLAVNLQGSDGLGDTISLTIPSGISGNAMGNLLDLKIAYAVCAVGSTSATPTAWIPMELG